MKLYNQEKVLYLIDKKQREGGLPFHVKTKELGQGKTTLAGMMPGMLKAKTVVEVPADEMPNNSKDRSGNKIKGYHITDLGRLHLAALQARSRHHMEKPLDNVAAYMAPLLIKKLGDAQAQQLVSMLNEGPAVAHRASEENEPAVRMMNRLQMTRSDNDPLAPDGVKQRMYTPLPFAVALGQALASVPTRQRAVAPVASKPRVRVLAGPDAVGDDPAARLLGLKVAAAFREDMVVPLDPDAPCALLTELLAAQMAEEHMRDDAYVYLKPTEAGIEAIKTHRQALRTSQGVSFSDYLAIGTAAFSQVNPLHWDGAFEDEMSLFDALEDACNAPAPVSIAPVSAQLNEAVNRAAAFLPNTGSPTQLKAVAGALMDNQGEAYEPALLDQAVSAYIIDKNTTLANAPGR